MSVVTAAARWLVTRQAKQQPRAAAVRHIEHDYRYPPGRIVSFPGADAELRRASMHLVGRR